MNCILIVRMSALGSQEKVSEQPHVIADIPIDDVTAAVDRRLAKVRAA
jgi:hypothetical protein